MSQSRHNFCFFVESQAVGQSISNFYLYLFKVGSNFFYIPFLLADSQGENSNNCERKDGGLCNSRPTPLWKELPHQAHWGINFENSRVAIYEKKTILYNAILPQKKPLITSSKSCFSWESPTTNLHDPKKTLGDTVLPCASLPNAVEKSFEIPQWYPTTIPQAETGIQKNTLGGENYEFPWWNLAIYTPPTLLFSLAKVNNANFWGKTLGSSNECRRRLEVPPPQFHDVTAVTRFMAGDKCVLFKSVQPLVKLLLTDTSGI